MPSCATAIAATALLQQAAGGTVPAHTPVMRLVLSTAVAHRAAAGAQLAAQLRIGCQVGAGQAGAGAQRLGPFDAQRQGSPLLWALLRLPPFLGLQGGQQGWVIDFTDILAQELQQGWQREGMQSLTATSKK